VKTIGDTKIFKAELKKRLQSLFGSKWAVELAAKHGCSGSWIRQYFNNQSYSKSLNDDATNLIQEEISRRELALKHSK